MTPFARVVRGTSALFALVCGACTPGGNGNVNSPRGNSIGDDRLPGFVAVVEHAKTLPEGLHSPATFPPGLQLKNLIGVYVHPGKAYALEFPSIPIDSNPIYVFVEDSVPHPEEFVRSIHRPGWHFGRKLDDRGWYYVHGP